MDEFFLSQIITNPTRGQNILDLCFIDIEDTIVPTEVQETNMYDQKLVVIDTLYNLNTVNHHQQQNREGLQELNISHSRTNWDEINRELTNIKWQEKLTGRSIEKMNLILLEKI